MQINRKKPLLTIVDIGALGGIHKKWEQTKYRAVLFEPNPMAKFQERQNWLVLNSALSDQVEERNLFITRKSSNSSFYVPNFDLLNKFSNPARFDVVDEINLKTDTLDNQLKMNKVLDVDYIKLDVQGHELSILKGGIRSLEKAVAVEIEVEFSPIYKNQPLFADVDKFLKEKNFELVGFLNLETWEYGDRKCLIWGDALYVKNLENLNYIKRERLSVIKEVIFSNNSYKDVYSKRYRGLVDLVKFLIKKSLSHVGLRNPSLGIKISAREKAATLLQYKSADVKIFVETGASKGFMIESIGKYFEKVYSIELDERLYQKTLKRFSGFENIHLLQGDSADKIKDILRELNKRALFWLDAHGSGEITTDNSPIYNELKEIFSHHIKGHIILIDDARLFDRNTIREIKKLAQMNSYNFVIKNGIFRLNEK